MANACAPAVPSSDRHAPSVALWPAFRRTFNLRSVAAVFYLTLLLVIARTIIVFYGEPLDQWALSTLRFLRQSLISGMLVLFGVALADAIVSVRRLERRSAVILATCFAAIAAAGSMALRTMTFGSPVMNVFMNWSYFIGFWASWTTLGGLGYALLFLSREDAKSQSLLMESACRRESLAAQMTQARLSALQAQIEPHFLFNTLANVKRLYETAPDKGREMLASLIDYLRAALPSMRANGATLAGELELVRSFLTILQMRMGERLSFSIDAPAELHTASMPPLLLPTLVENAIKHGLSPLPEGGVIDVRAFVAGAERDLLRVQVRDTGAGFRASSGTGVGLANTRSRLAALFGDRASLTLASNQPRGVVATVTLPLQTALEASR